MQNDERPTTSEQDGGRVDHGLGGMEAAAGSTPTPTAGRTRRPGDEAAHVMDEASSTLYRVATRVEDDEALDGAVRAMERLLPEAVRRGPVRDLLGGRWLGHALHPMLTDFPLGAWMSASLLDLVGGKASRTASRRLIGFGILMAVPTALSGASDWTVASHRERRVGVVHAATNTVALSLYSASFVARRRGRHRRGVALGMAGGVAGTVGGFFGGHLTMARDTGLRATESALDRLD